MSFKRVIPRDFFNTAKLLKCLGRFELLRVDKNLPFRVDFDNKAFEIHQDDSDGSLYCSNYKVYLNEMELHLKIPYNSKNPWPLEASYKDGDYYIFDDDGNFMPNFGHMGLERRLKGIDND